MGPNIIQQEKRMESISDEALQQLLRQMAQTNQVGTPGFILAAGELQGRKEARQQSMLGKGNPRPVIADLLMGDAMPSQMPMLPENAGGIAALPAPNMEGIATLAGGGLVAFAGGGDIEFSANGTPKFQAAGRVPTETELRAAYDKWMKAKGPWYLPSPRANMEAANAEREYNELLQARQMRRPVEGLGAVPVAAPPVVAQPTVAAPAATAQPAQGAGAAPAAGTTAVPPTAAPTAGVAPATVPTPDYTTNYNQAKTFVEGIFGKAPELPLEPTVQNIKKEVEDTRQMFKDLGIADPTDLRKKQIEDAMKNAKTEKQNAGWTWLANFGAAWAAENGPALQAAAKANAKTMPGLMSDLKDVNKLQREQQKELAGLEALKAQSERDMTLKARDRLRDERAKIQDRIDQRNKDIATASVSLAANVATNATTLQGARIGAESRRYEVDTAERRINAMPGATYQEKLTNYYKAITPRATGATDELEKAAASLAKDPTKLATLKATDPALYAALYPFIMQRINTLAVPNVTGTPTGTVRD